MFPHSHLQMHSILLRSNVHVTKHHHHLFNPYYSFFLNLLHTSPPPPPTDHPHFITTYLTTTLNLTPPEATTIATKIPHIKTPQNTHSVITFLRSFKLTEPQIKSIVLTQPTILLRNVNKTLTPKFKYLSGLGFCNQDLVNVLNRDPNILVRSLGTSIVPTVELMMAILGSKEDVVKAIKKSHWPFYGKSFRVNVALLERYGVTGKDIRRVILRNPRLVTQSPVRLEEKLVEIEREFGIKPGSGMFSYGLSAICSLNNGNLRRKFEVFKSFGWGDSDVVTIVGRQPLCVTHSEERLRKGLSFFMGELGYTPQWLATRGSLLMYSLEKRVKPRYEVYAALKEKGVIAREVQSVMCLSEADFVKDVVLRHKDAMPDHLYDSFVKSVKI